MIMTIIRNTITSIVLITVGYAAAPTTVQKVIGKNGGGEGIRNNTFAVTIFKIEKLRVCVYISLGCFVASKSIWC